MGTDRSRPARGQHERAPGRGILHRWRQPDRKVESAAGILLDRQLLGGPAVEDVRAYPRRKVSPLGGAVELTPAWVGNAAKSRRRLPLLLFLRPWLRSHKVTGSEREWAQGRAACFAVVQSSNPPGGCLGCKRRRLHRG